MEKQPEPGRGQDDEVTAQFFGLQVRNFYIQQKSLVMRRPYRMHPRWDTAKFWLGVGQLCLTLNARPDQFVRAQFEEDRNAHGPFPNALTGAAAAKKYRRWSGVVRSPEEKATEGGAMREDVSLVSTALVRANRSCARMFPGMPLGEGYRSPLVDMPAWLRLLMLPDDPTIAQQWGLEGQLALTKNVALLNQCRRLGLPVAKIMNRTYDDPN
jgi:hypothetical protein